MNEPQQWVSTDKLKRFMENNGWSENTKLYSINYC